MNWQPIETAPFGKVLEVKNDIMDEPVLATRGFADNGLVNPNLNLFTSAYTPHSDIPFPEGRLVCPTHWREPPQ